MFSESIYIELLQSSSRGNIFILQLTATLSESPTYTEQEKKKSHCTKNNLPQAEALFDHYQCGAMKAEHTRNRSEESKPQEIKPTSLVKGCPSC